MKKIFIIGAQRSGTTFLNQAISLHNSIIGINTKKYEPKTFLYEKWPVNDKHYESMFKLDSISKKDFCIEKSTSYYENIYVAERIKASIKDAKIIFVARNPMDRLKSNYKFSKKNGLENLEFKNAIINSNRKYNTSVNPYSYINRSLYSNYLIFWKFLFQENLKIILFEDLIKDTNQTIAETLSWLNLSYDDNFFEKISKLNFYNSSNYELKMEHLGFVEESLSYLFRKEKLEMEKLLGHPIESWNFE